MTAAKIHVNVKLFGHLRQISQQPALELEMYPGSTVNDLVVTMSVKLGDDFRQALVDSKGNLHGGIEIVLNEEHLPVRKIASILVPDNCTIYFVPMIEGG